MIFYVIFITYCKPKKYTKLLKINIFKLSIFYIIICVLYFINFEINVNEEISKVINILIGLVYPYLLIIDFLFMCSIFTRHNKFTHIAFLKNINIIMSSIILFLVLFSKEDLNSLQNKNLIISICLLNLILFIFSNEKNDYKINSKILEKTPEIDNYQEPFESRKLLLYNLKNKFMYSEKNNFLTREGLSICINAIWGVGKTTFINQFITELNKDEPNKYIEIRIDALEIDNLNSLFDYFYEKIKNILKQEGVYLGLSSELRKFISSSLKVLTKYDIEHIFSNYFKPNIDYREQKEELSNLLSKVLNNRKILIIVDDIDRCDNDKSKQFIYFIKEVATVKNCISIFLCDINKLIYTLNEHTKETPLQYFDKFFNEIIFLHHLDDAEKNQVFKYNTINDVIIVNKYLKYKNDINYYINYIESCICATFNSLLNPKYKNTILNESLQKRFIISYTKNYDIDFKNEEANKELLLNFIISFKRRIDSDFGNARKLTKIVQKYKENVSIIENDYIKNNINKNNYKINFLYYILGIDYIIFILSYLEISYPFEFKKFIKGIRNNTPSEFICKSIIKNAYEELDYIIFYIAIFEYFSKVTLPLNVNEVFLDNQDIFRKFITCIYTENNSMYNILEEILTIRLNEFDKMKIDSIIINNNSEIFLFNLLELLINDTNKMNEYLSKNRFLQSNKFNININTNNNITINQESSLNSLLRNLYIIKIYYVKNNKNINEKNINQFIENIFYNLLKKNNRENNLIEIQNYLNLVFFSFEKVISFLYEEISISNTNNFYINEAYKSILYNISNIINYESLVLNIKNSLNDETKKEIKKLIKLDDKENFSENLSEYIISNKDNYNHNELLKNFSKNFFNEQHIIYSIYYYYDKLFRKNNIHEGNLFNYELNENITYIMGPNQKYETYIKYTIQNLLNSIFKVIDTRYPNDENYFIKDDINYKLPQIAEHIWEALQNLNLQDKIYSIIEIFLTIINSVGDFNIIYSIVCEKFKNCNHNKLEDKKIKNKK